jgi:hypothetical protein
MTDYRPAGHSIVQVKFKDLDIEQIVENYRKDCLTRAYKRAEQAASMAYSAVVAQEMKNIERGITHLRAEHVKERS